MNLPSSRNGWIEWAGLTAAALVFSQMSVLFFLFLVPLQVVYYRRGYEGLAISGSILLIGVTIFGLFRTRGVDSAGIRQGMLLLELALPVLLFGGLLLVNFSGLQGYRGVLRHLAASALAALISIPVIGALSHNVELMELLKQQFSAIAEAFQSGFAGGESYDSVVLSGILAPERMVEYTKTLFFKSYMFLYFILLTGSVFIAETVLMRIRGVFRRRLDTFSVPDVFIWPLLIGWAGVLIDIWKGMGFIGYAFWNLGLVFLFLFGLQGIGVLRALLGRLRVPLFIRMFIGLVCITLITRPGLNLIVFIGIPGLGVSELWVRYRQNQ